MARHESDREDLLREATALVERIELAPTGQPQREHVTAGFRRGGELSIFFGADPVYQFNASGQLRRAYSDGLLFKAAAGGLVSLRRARRHGEVQLLRHDLTEVEQTAFLAQMTNRLRNFAAQLDDGYFDVVGQVPADANILQRLRNWLTQYHGSVANTPHVG